MLNISWGTVIVPHERKRLDQFLFFCNRRHFSMMSFYSPGLYGVLVSWVVLRFVYNLRIKFRYDIIYHVTTAMMVSLFLIYQLYSNIPEFIVLPLVVDKILVNLWIYCLICKIHSFSIVIFHNGRNIFLLFCTITLAKGTQKWYVSMA